MSTQPLDIGINCLALSTDKPIGVERFCRNILSEVQLRSSNIFCFTQKSVSNLSQILDEKFIKQHGSLTHTTFSINTTIWRILVEMLLLPFYTRNLDVILSINNFGPLWGKRNQRRVVIIHDVWFMSEAYNGSFISKQIFKLLISLQIRCSHQILTVSNFSRREISKHFHIRQNRISVIENCLPSSSLTPHILTEDDNDFLLLIGSDRQNKNIWKALEAYEYFSQSNPTMSIPVVMIGKYSRNYLDNIEKRFSACFRNLVIKGFVSDEDLHMLYASCKGVIFPSLYEGFGIPAVEAILKGKPVLISANTACAEITGDLAIVVNGNSMPSISEGIEKLLGHTIDTFSSQFIDFKTRFSDCRQQGEKLSRFLLNDTTVN